MGRKSRLGIVPLALAIALGVTATPATPADPSPTDIGQAGATKLSVMGDWLAAGAGAIWLSAPGNRLIRRLDPGTGALAATIRVPQDPCEATDVGFGSLWTATCVTPGLARIDPATNKVSGFVRLAIPEALDGEASVGAGVGGVWLVVDGKDCSACRVARINPKTLRVAARIPVRVGAAAVRTGSGGVWVTNPAHDLVQKIDPRTNRVVATTKVSGQPRFLDVAEGNVWTLSQVDGAVTRIDPVSAKVVASVAAGVNGDGGDMTAGGGWAWARGMTTLLVRIDARTNQVVERYGPPSGSGAAVVGFGAVWISAHDVQTVWRLPLPTA